MNFNYRNIDWWYWIYINQFVQRWYQKWSTFTISELKNLLENFGLIKNKSQLYGPLLYELNMIGPQSWNKPIFIIVYRFMFQVLQYLLPIFKFSISSLFSVFSIFSGFVLLLYFPGLPFVCIMRFFISFNSQFFTYIFVYFQVSISFIFSGFTTFFIFSRFLYFLYFYALHVLYFEFPLPLLIGFLSRKCVI